MAVTPESVWDFLLSPEGLKLWLAELEELEPVKGYRYAATDGSTGEMRAAKRHEQLRLTWQRKDWAQPSTVQIRLLPAAKGRTTVSFHQEKLADEEARGEMKQRWERVLEELEARLGV